MTVRIEATCNKKSCPRKKTNRKYTWTRQFIGDIIENVPEMIKRDGFYKDVKITYA